MNYGYWARVSQKELDPNLKFERKQRSTHGTPCIHRKSREYIRFVEAAKARLLVITCHPSSGIVRQRNS